MRTLLRNALLLTLLLGCFPACGTSQSDSKKTPVATVGGQTVYEDEILPRVQNDIRKLRLEEYQLKQRAIENLILTRLLEAEAKKRNLTVDQLIQQEADGKLADPTDAEIRAQFDQQKDTRKFEDVKEQYRASLKQARVRAARQAYFRQLWDSAGVKMLLQPPRTEVAADPARVRGNPKGPVMIVEFSDFQCPYCRRVQPTLMAVLAKFPGQVGLSFRDFPLREIHPDAQSAAEAARCAGEQGKFWEYHDLLFSQAPLDRITLGAHAGKLGLDAKRFDACLASGKFRAAVEEDLQVGVRAGVAGTPGFFINGIFLDGAQPLEEFARIINDELAALKK